MSHLKYKRYIELKYEFNSKYFSESQKNPVTALRSHHTACLFLGKSHYHDSRESSVSTANYLPTFYRILCS